MRNTFALLRVPRLLLGRLSSKPDRRVFALLLALAAGALLSGDTGQHLLFGDLTLRVTQNG